MLINLPLRTIIMRIGKNLIRHRNAKGWSQEDVASMAGMSQSNYSKIESDKQDVKWEQIESLANILETEPEELIRQDSIVLNIETQNGGNANNYVVQNNAEAIIAAKDETIASLKAHLKGLEDQNQFLRDQIQK